MSKKPSSLQTRRSLLKLLGGTAVFVPLASLHGCSGEEKPAAPKAADTTAPASQPKAPTSTMSDTKPLDAPTTEASDTMLPKLTEDSAQAVALGYLHDASKVNKSKYSRYAAGQICGNCALYQDKSGSEWGGCSLFPRNTVNKNGWCSAYVPVPVE